MNIKKTLYNALKETFKHLNYSEDDISLTFSSKEGAYHCTLYGLLHGTAYLPAA